MEYHAVISHMHPKDSTIFCQLLADDTYYQRILGGGILLPEDAKPFVGQRIVITLTQEVKENA